MPTLDVENFTKGVTDNYVNGDPQAAKKLDNLLINEFGKLVQCPGLNIYNSSAPQIPAGNQSIDSMYYFDSTLFVKSGTKLYYLQSGDTSFTTLAGPTSNDAFADSELGAKVSWSEWRGHLFATPGPSTNIKGGCRTVKMYRNASNVWTLVQAGMPDIKKSYNALFTAQPTIASTAPSVSYIWAEVLVLEYIAKVNGVVTVFKDYGAPRISPLTYPYIFNGGISSANIPTPAQVNTSLENYDTTNMRVELYRTKFDQTELFYTTSSPIGDDSAGSFATETITASGSNASGIFRVATTSFTRKFYIGQRLILDDSNSSPVDVFVIGLDSSTGDITVSATRGGAAYNGSSYATAQTATFQYRIYVDSTQDPDLGHSALVLSVTGSGSGASGIFTVSTTDVKYLYIGQEVEIDDGNSAPLKVWVIAVNFATGDVTFSKTRGGTAGDLSAYTTAQTATLTIDYVSVLPPGYNEGNYNDPFPPCYFTAIADSFGWAAAPVDTAAGQHRATRALQSKPGIVGGMPSGNYVEIPTDKQTAFSYAGQHPVTFSRNSCYRLEGRYDAFGNGQIRAILISASEGSVSQDVIKTPQGIFFPSENGWCFTDGFQVTNYSKRHLRRTYSELSTKSRMAGCFDSQAQRVYFAVESSSLSPTVSGKNNAAFVLDMNQSEAGAGVFTTHSGAANFQPAAMHYDSVNQKVIVGDSRGYIFSFDSTLTTWPVVDTASAYSTWARTAIIWNWITCSFSFGSTRMSKWMTEVSLVLKNLTGNVSINFWSYKDDRSTGVEMKAVRDRSITSGLHKIFRRFPKGNISCVYAAVQAKKGYVVICNSDTRGLATFAGTTNTVQIATGTWPEDGVDNLVGHFIHPLQAGEYTTGWEISVDSGNTLTVLDPGNTLPTGSLKWVIKGYPKNEGVEIHAMGIEYSPLGEGYPERSNQGGNA